MDTMQVEGILLGFLNWLTVMIMRRFWPGLWDSLDKRIVRLLLIAITAGIMAGVAGAIQGIGWLAILKLAISAFATSIATRELTKEESPALGGYMPTLSRHLSIKTDVPEPPK